MRGRGWRRDWRLPEQGSRCIDAGQASHGSRFGIAFDADELPGEKQCAASFELQRIEEELRRIDERVAMEAPIPEELGLFEPGDHAKHALLFRVGQFSLKAHQVVTGAMDILRSQLDDGGGLDSGSGVFQSDRLEGAKLHGLAATFCQHFNRHAGFKIGRLLKFLRLYLFRGHQGIVKGIVLCFRHRTIQIIISALIIARGTKDHVHIDRVCVHDRRDGVVEI